MDDHASMAGDDLIQVQTTVGSRADGERIGQAMVDARLAACAQLLGPIESRYRWQDGLTVSQEWLLLLKARRVDWDALAAGIRQLHPYEVPELIAIPMLEVSADYGAWVIAETERAPDTA